MKWVVRRRNLDEKSEIQAVEILQSSLTSRLLIIYKDTQELVNKKLKIVSLLGDPLGRRSQEEKNGNQLFQMLTCVCDG